MISANRPAAPIFALTHSKKVFSGLNFLWGVNPILVSRKFSDSQYIQFAQDTIKKLKLGKKGDYIILLSGSGMDRCSTHSIKIHHID